MNFTGSSSKCGIADLLTKPASEPSGARRIHRAIFWCYSLIRNKSLAHTTHHCARSLKQTAQCHVHSFLSGWRILTLIGFQWHLSVQNETYAETDKETPEEKLPGFKIGARSGERASCFLFVGVCVMPCVSTGLFHQRILAGAARRWLISEQPGFRWLSDNTFFFSRPHPFYYFEVLNTLWSARVHVFHWPRVRRSRHACMWPDDGEAPFNVLEEHLPGEREAAVLIEWGEMPAP